MRPEWIVRLRRSPDCDPERLASLYEAHRSSNVHDRIWTLVEFVRHFVPERGRPRPLLQLAGLGHTTALDAELLAHLFARAGGTNRPLSRRFLGRALCDCKSSTSAGVARWAAAAAFGQYLWACTATRRFDPEAKRLIESVSPPSAEPVPEVLDAISPYPGLLKQVVQVLTLHALSNPVAFVVERDAGWWTSDDSPGAALWREVAAFGSTHRPHALEFGIASGIMSYRRLKNGSFDDGALGPLDSLFRAASRRQPWHDMLSAPIRLLTIVAPAWRDEAITAVLRFDRWTIAGSPPVSPEGIIDQAVQWVRADPARLAKVFDRPYTFRFQTDSDPDAHVPIRVAPEAILLRIDPDELADFRERYLEATGPLDGRLATHAAAFFDDPGDEDVRRVFAEAACFSAAESLRRHPTSIDFFGDITHSPRVMPSIKPELMALLSEPAAFELPALTIDSMFEYVSSRFDPCGDWGLLPYRWELAAQVRVIPGHLTSLLMANALTGEAKADVARDSLAALRAPSMRPAGHLAAHIGRAGHHREASRGGFVPGLRPGRGPYGCGVVGLRAPCARPDVPRRSRLADSDVEDRESGPGESCR